MRTTHRTEQAAGVSAALAELGFAPREDGRGYRQNGTVLVPHGDWSQLAEIEGTAMAASGDPLRAQMGRPGLWRLVRREGMVRYECDLPPCLIKPSSTASSRVDQTGVAVPITAGLAWLMATAAGELPRDWVLPPRQEIESVIEPDMLVLRCGTATVQGSLIHQPSRLALVFPLAHRMPAEMPSSRHCWLREILHDAQARWRLVRLGFAGDTGGGVMAEVDLTGVPAALVRPLVSIALAALRWVVAWVLPSVALAIDLQIESRMLASHPVPVRSGAKHRSATHQDT